MTTHWRATVGGFLPRGVTTPVARRLLSLAVASVLFAGCGKPAPSVGTGPPPVPPGNSPAAGGDVLAKLPGGEGYAACKKVYADNNCARCHKLGETGGGAGGPMGAMGGPPDGGGRKGGGMNGPDLTAVGADAAHTPRWLGDHVRDPKSHQPQSRMPASGPEKISESDLTALSGYLASRV